MGATPHNLSAIDAMGAQFKHNVFDKLPGKFMKVAKAARSNTGGPMTVTGSGSNFRTTSSAPKPGPKALPRGGQVATRGSGNAPAGGWNGKVYTARPVGTTALPAGTPHIQATSVRLDQNRSSSGTTPHVVGLPKALPAGSGGSMPHGPAPRVQNSSQFVDVTPKDNSPFPTHQHPEGSSNLKLGNLSAAQPKPNDFTVGSRNAKPGGIAARGSQLEAWAISKSQAVQARQASRKAGGRDRGLAAEAKRAENFANQPLRNFAP